MPTNANFNKIKAWPFIEAFKVFKSIKNNTVKKIINFETGYGPSGVPHIEPWQRF